MNTGDLNSRPTEHEEGAMIVNRDFSRKQRSYKPQAESCESRQLLAANFIGSADFLGFGDEIADHFADDAMADVAAEIASGMNFSDSPASIATFPSRLVVTARGDLASNGVAPYFRPVSASAATDSSRSSAAMAKIGEPIQLTAQVNPASSRGAVAFFANDAKIGEAAVANGAATITIDDLPEGNYQLSAKFQGADGFASSASLIVPAALSSADKQTTYTEAFTDNSPSELGDRVNLAAFVRKGGLGGIGSAGDVSFYSDGQFLGTANVVGGLATFAVSSLELGKHKITAKFNGTNEFAPSISLPITQNVTASQAKRTFTEVFSDNPSVSADKGTTFSAYVRQGLSEGVGSQGTVTFMADGRELGTSEVVDSVARLRVTSLGVGEHRVTAKFNGGGDLLTSTAEAIAQTITPVAAPTAPARNAAPSAPKPTSIQLSTNGNSFPPGVSVSLSANVFQGSRPLSEGGFVEFFADGRLLGLAPVIGGEAILDTDDLAIGNHSLTAYYNGDRDFAPSLSEPENVQISESSKVATFAWLWVEPNQQAGGSNNYTVRAFVSDRFATGAIQLFDGRSLLGSASLSDGIAEFNVNLTPGEHSLKGVYAGDSVYEGSESILFQRRA